MLTCPGCKREVSKATLIVEPGGNGRAECCPYCLTRVIDQASDHMLGLGIHTDENGRIAAPPESGIGRHKE